MSQRPIPLSPDLWDQASREYDSNIGARALKGAQELVGASLQMSPITLTSRILDVGTGARNIPMAIREIHPSVAITAIDSSPEMVDILVRRNIRKVTTGVSDAKSLDRELVPEEFFTHAFCALLLQFVDDKQMAVLAEIFNSLQPGGVIAVSISNHLGIVEPMHDAWKLVDPSYIRADPFAHTWHTSEQLREGLEVADFTDFEAFDIVIENRPKPGQYR